MEERKKECMCERVRGDREGEMKREEDREWERRRGERERAKE